MLLLWRWTSGKQVTTFEGRNWLGHFKKLIPYISVDNFYRNVIIFLKNLTVQCKLTTANSSLHLSRNVRCNQEIFLPSTPGLHCVCRSPSTQPQPCCAESRTFTEVSCRGPQGLCPQS